MFLSKHIHDTTGAVKRGVGVSPRLRKVVIFRENETILYWDRLDHRFDDGTGRLRSKASAVSEDLFCEKRRTTVEKIWGV